MEPIRAAAVQMTSLPGDVAGNWATAERHIAAAAEAGARLIALPECCLTGYWHLRKLSREAMWDLAEPVPDGPSCQRLRALAARYQVLVGAGFIEREEASGRLYKAWAAALPDGQLHSHRKLHAFVNPHLTGGDQYTVFDTPWGWRVGVLICYDNNLIENVRCTALLGADVLLAPHQTGGCGSPNPHQMGLVDRELWARRHEDPAAIEAELAGPKGRGWLLRWLPARAHDNGLFVVFSNGIGPDDDEIRTGNAMIIDPYGRILAETGRADDAVVVADLDPELFHLNTGRRWLRSRRPELYGLLAQRTGQEVDTRTALREEKDFGGDQ